MRLVRIELQTLDKRVGALGVRIHTEAFNNSCEGPDNELVKPSGTGGARGVSYGIRA